MFSATEAEMGVLGCFLIDNGLLKETKLSTETFGYATHRLVFRAMRAVETSGQALDIVTLTAKFGSHIGQIGGVKYLSDLQNSVITVRHFRDYESIVLEEWKKREAQSVAKELLAKIESGQDESFLSGTIAKLSAIEETGVTRTNNKRHTLVRLHEKIATRDGQVRGIPTGYDDFDRLTFGLLGGQFIVIGGRPAMGKTAFASNMATNAEDYGTVTSFFSLEMSEESLYERMISSRGFLPRYKLRNPNQHFSPDEWKRYNNAFAWLDQQPLEIFDAPNITVSEIRSTLRARKRAYPNHRHLAIIDYIQLIKGDERVNREQQVSKISRELKLTARELDMPIVALAQLNRDLEKRNDKRPMMSDLRESGSIEQDADIIAFLYRDEYYNAKSEHKGLVELIVAKHREGETGVLNLSFNGAYNLMTNLNKYKG